MTYALTLTAHMTESWGVLAPCTRPLRTIGSILSLPLPNNTNLSTIQPTRDVHPLLPGCLHFEMAVSRDKSRSRRRFSTVSPSSNPSMIWSRMFLRLHSSVQNLDKLRRLTKRSSNVSPGCCTCFVKLHL